MGLKKLAAALLPRAYREQVLGDLQERGFHVADLVSVLPRVWWSSVRRSFSVPNLAGASEDVIRRRTERMEAFNFAWMQVCLTTFITGTLLDPQRGSWERAFAWCLALALLAGLVTKIIRRPVLSSQSAVERHKRLLTQLRNYASMGSPYLMAVVAANRLLQAFFPEPAAVLLKFSGITGCFVYGHFRARQLQKEITCLQ